MGFWHANHRRPLVLNNLDGYRAWSIKHRHWEFDVLEDEAFDLWICTAHLRAFFAGFPNDKALQSTHWRSMVYAKEHKAFYVSESAMRQLLRSSSKHHSFHTDVLKFLDWFERNISQVAARKRMNHKLDERNALREQEAAAISGPVAPQLAHPRFEDSTLPLTPQERWAMEQQSGQPRRVFHPEALPVRLSAGDVLRARAIQCVEYLKAYWHGQGGMFKTFALGLAVLWVPIATVSMLFPDSLDWAVHIQRVLWSFVLLAVVSVVCGVAYVVMLTRSLMRAWSHASARVLALTFYLAVIALGPFVMVLGYDQEMLSYWWAGVRGNLRPMDIYADPHLGRIVAKGPMDFGSSEALRVVLEKNPSYTLIQMESPGGFVVEGMRMAQLVEARKMDTVSLDQCASACTLVVAVGQDRYLGPDAHFGFHRSGRRNVLQDLGWSETDSRIAELYRSHGANQSFVEKALKEPMFRIWEAPHDEMLESGYANKLWSERKSGY